MKTKFLLILPILLAFAFMIPVHAVDVDGCLNITSSDTYTLNTSILNYPLSSTNCIYITVPNVTFDCNGYTIDGTDQSSSVGIYIGNDSITIQNCVLSDWTYGIRGGIVSANLIITNVSSSSSDYGIAFTNSITNAYVDLNSNTITGTNASGSYGIYFGSNNNNNITLKNGIINNCDHAVYFADVAGVNNEIFIDNMQMLSAPNITGSTGLSITNMNNSILSSLVIVNGSQSRNSLTLVRPSNSIIDAVYINGGNPVITLTANVTSSFNNVIRNLQVVNASGFNIAGQNLTFYNVTISDSSSNSASGLTLTQLQNSHVYNVTIEGYKRNGFVFSTNVNNVVVEDVTIRNVATETSSVYSGISLSTYNYGNTIKDSNVNSYGYAITSANTTDFLIYNNVFNSSNSSFYRNPFYENWSFIDNYNNSERGNYWYLHNASGFSDTCYDNNDDDICELPYQLNAYLYDYLPLTENGAAPPPEIEYNLTGCVQINDTGEYQLMNDIINSSESQCIVINTNDILIDCNDYIIDGISGSATDGINAEGFNNITIQNCIIKNWGYAIYLDNINGIIINDSELYDNTRNGIYMNSVDNSFILELSIYNNTNANIEMNGITYMYMTGNTFYGSTTTLQVNTVSDSVFFSNIFNTTSDWIQGSFNNPNTWNTTVGNYWFKSDNTGFSNVCNVSTSYKCNTVFTIETDNVDYLPQTYKTYVAPVIPPTGLVTGTMASIVLLIFIIMGLGMSIIFTKIAMRNGRMMTLQDIIAFAIVFLIVIFIVSMLVNALL